MVLIKKHENRNRTLETMENEEFDIMYKTEQSHWWFRGKQDILRRSLCTLSKKTSEKNKILDIGAGTGVVLKVLQDFGETFGIEHSLHAIKYLKDRGLKQIICADANQSIPFKNDTFTFITCLDVLEHLEKDVELLNEMVRISKPGGYIIVAVPAFKMFWSQHDIALHHKRRYTKKQLLRILKKIDCQIIKVTYYNIILSLPILAVRKFKTIFHRNKPIQSDVFMNFPNFLNILFGFLYKAEIWCLKFINFPFGVSILFVLKKYSENQFVNVER